MDITKSKPPSLTGTDLHKRIKLLCKLLKIDQALPILVSPQDLLGRGCKFKGIIKQVRSLPISGLAKTTLLDAEFSAGGLVLGNNAFLYVEHCQEKKEMGNNLLPDHLLVVPLKTLLCPPLHFETQAIDPSTLEEKWKDERNGVTGTWKRSLQAKLKLNEENGELECCSILTGEALGCIRANSMMHPWPNKTYHRFPGIFYGTDTVPTAQEREKIWVKEEALSKRAKNYRSGVGDRTKSMKL